MLMIVLDVTIVNVALPSIQDELHFSSAALAWVVNAYLIAFGGLLLLAGRFGDLSGAAACSSPASTLFTVASLLCGLARTPGPAGRRALRAGRRRRDDLGRDPGDDRDDVPRAARAGARRSASTRSSPRPAARSACWLGGVITQSIDWHWIFFVNVPVGIATVVLARGACSSPEHGHRARRAARTSPARS